MMYLLLITEKILLNKSNKTLWGHNIIRNQSTLEWYLFHTTPSRITFL